VVVLQPQRDLFEVVSALRSSGGLTRRLDGRQQQRNQNSNNCDNHQQFHQGEGAFALSSCGRQDRSHHATLFPIKWAKDLRSSHIEVLTNTDLVARDKDELSGVLFQETPTKVYY
jgi:hypothetical protein